MGLEIVDYQPAHQPDFARLNLRWLEAYFTVEPIDEQVLGDPDTHIISPGGSILMAVDGSNVLGTCALKVHGTQELELTKMAVDPASQGQGAGKLLMSAAISRFRGSGRRLLWLETNHILTTAIGLYQHFGFQRIGDGPRPGSGYQRSDYYMVWQQGGPESP